MTAVPSPTDDTARAEHPRARRVELVAAVALAIAIVVVAIVATRGLRLPTLMQAATERAVPAPGVPAAWPIEGFPDRETGGGREWWWMTAPSGTIHVSGERGGAVVLSMAVVPPPCGPTSILLAGVAQDVGAELPVSVTVPIGPDGYADVEVVSTGAPCGAPTDARQLFVGVFDLVVTPAPS